MRFEKTIYCYDNVYPPEGLSDVFIKRAIKKVKSKYTFVEFEYLSYIRVIYLKLKVWFEPLSPYRGNEITSAANALRHELNKSNELYQLLKEVYGLEPKKSWWKRLLNWQE